MRREEVLLWVAIGLFVLVLIILVYIASLLATDGPICMADPLAYAKSLNLSFIELPEWGMG
jgi:hypothetical protein